MDWFLYDIGLRHERVKQKVFNEVFLYLLNHYNRGARDEFMQAIFYKRFPAVTSMGK